MSNLREFERLYDSLLRRFNREGGDRTALDAAQEVIQHLYEKENSEMSELPTPPNVPEWLEDILLLNPPSCRDCFRAAAYSLLWSDEAMLLETESFTILDMSVPNEEKRRLIEVHKQLEEAAHEKSELCATRFRELCK